MRHFFAATTRTPWIAIASLVAAGPLVAQDKAPKPFEFAGDAGFVMTSGNTAVTTLSPPSKADSA